MLESTQVSLLAEIDDRLAELSALLRHERKAVLHNYGFTDDEMFPVDRRSYFKTLNKLERLTAEQIEQYCAVQFSTSTSAESVRFLLRHRWLLIKCLTKLRISGIRHFYFSDSRAALDGLGELTRLAHFVAPRRAVASTR